MLKIFRQTFAEQLADEYRTEFGKSVSPSAGTTLAEFDEDNASGNGPFREMVGSQMWPLAQTRTDISNAVRAVVTYRPGS